MEDTPPVVGDAAGPEMIPQQSLASVQVPRISIRYCTQCRWMLRAAYYAQELLSTFSTSLGEVALVPATGGVFTVDLTYTSPLHAREETAVVGGPRSVGSTTRLWDRKVQGGFPETKTLKKLVRDIIDPSRDLGHVDRSKVPVSAAPLSTPDSSATGNIDQPLASRSGINEARKLLPEESSTGYADGKPGGGGGGGGVSEEAKDQIKDGARSEANPSENLCEECS